MFLEFQNTVQAVMEEKTDEDVISLHKKIIVSAVALLCSDNFGVSVGCAALLVLGPLS